MGGVFTQSVTQVTRRAVEEAVRLNHPYIGPEHIHFGLLEDPTVANLLNTYGIQPDEVRRQVESLLEPGYRPLPPGKLPFTPRAKTVFEYAIEESRQLDDSAIGPEFLLLSLLREGGNAAGMVLRHAFGLRPEPLREHLRRSRERH
jgi:ATP-dependent Clp protease ATP-binding subunit ClpC